MMLYGYETSSLNLKEKYPVEMFAKNVLMRIFVPKKEELRKNTGSNCL